LFSLARIVQSNQPAITVVNSQAARSCEFTTSRFRLVRRVSGFMRPLSVNAARPWTDGQEKLCAQLHHLEFGFTRL
jgi:hypothetical protein